MAGVEVEWVCSPQEGAPLERMVLQLPAGATAADALRAVGRTLPSGWCLACWGKKVGLDAVLRPGDRLALLRPLSLDPMESRRRREALQGQGRRRPSRHRPQGGPG